MLHDISTPEWQKLFERFKNRAVSYQDIPDLVDPGILSVVKYINALPGVCTVYSCEGHPFAADRHGDVQEGPDKGYIFMVVRNEEAQAYLHKILNKVLAWMWVNVCPNSMFEIEGGLTSGLSDVLMDAHELYPGITIRTPMFNNTKIRDRWWKRFEHYLRIAVKSN